MHPEMECVLEAINSAVEGISDAELAHHPPGKWSPAEILEHLSLTYSSTARALGKCIAAGNPRLGADTFKQRARRFVVLTLGYMPPGRKAPEFTLPRGTAPLDVLSAIRQNLIAMDEAITGCERRFGEGQRIGNHPVLGPCTAAQWRRFHWVHTRHHMRQIARLRGEMREQAASA